MANETNQTAKAATAAATETAKPAGGPRRFIFPVIIGCIVLFGAYYGISSYIFGLSHQETDDAQVEGNIIPVIPRTGGFIAKVKFSDNQLVKAGDTLFTIDDRELRVRVEQADAALANARANVLVARANTGASESNVATIGASVVTARAQQGSFGANLATAQANVDAANIRVWKSTQDYNRYAALLKDKAVTQSQFDAAKAEKESAEVQVEVAKKQVAASERQIEVAKSQREAAEKQTTTGEKQKEASAQLIAVAEAGVKQREADLEFAKLQLTYATVTAPVAGRVSKKTIQVGQNVQAGQNLLSIVGSEDIWVVANFKETQLEKMQPNQTVDIYLDAFSGTKVTGKVESIAAASGAKFSLLPPDNAAGNFVKVVQRIPVKVAIDEKFRSLGLRPGMNAKVTVTTK